MQTLYDICLNADFDLISDSRSRKLKHTLKDISHIIQYIKSCNQKKSNHHFLEKSRGKMQEVYPLKIESWFLSKEKEDATGD